MQESPCIHRLHWNTQRRVQDSPRSASRAAVPRIALGGRAIYHRPMASRATSTVIPTLALASALLVGCASDYPSSDEGGAAASEGPWTLVSRADRDVNLFSVWQAGDGAIYAVGDRAEDDDEECPLEGRCGVVLRRAPGADPWVREQLPQSTPPLRAVHGSASGVGPIVAVGDLGALLVRAKPIRGKLPAWSMEAPPDAKARDLLGVFVSDETGAWAVGSSGAVLNRPGAEGWLTDDASSVDTLRAVVAVGSEVWAVGSFGTALHRTAAGWERTSTDTGRALAAVWAAGPQAVFAVGLEGGFLRWNGSAWAPIEHENGPYLRAIWGRSATDIYMAGWGGAVLHFDGRRVCDLSVRDWRLEALTGDAERIRVAGVGARVWEATLTGPCPDDAEGADAGAPIEAPDAGSPAPDAGPGPVDSGPAPVDSGPPAFDSGPGPVDSGPAPGDSGPAPPPDAAPPAEAGA